MKTNMPILPVEKMVEDMPESIKSAFFSAVKQNTTDILDGVGQLKTAKPFKNPKNINEVIANYIWRLLCFDYCEEKPHCCIPVNAFWDLEITCQKEFDKENWREKHKQLKEKLDVLITTAEKKFPMIKNAKRWGKLLGVI